MLVKNLQQKIHNCQEITYIPDMAEFSAAAFAKWLNEAFATSSFKSFSEVADAVGLSRATVSSYASARPQTVSNKASRPKRENVIKLAQVLNKNVDEALILAGHSPIKPTVLPEELAITGFDGLDKDDLKDIADYINFKRMQKQKKEEN